MAKVVDRIEELSSLEKEFARETSSLVVIYGRRRVGKTTLISEFIREKNAMYFLATEESGNQNLERLKYLAAGFIGSEILAKVTGLDYEDIFKMVVDAPSQKKKVIVIDEFSYLAKADSAFPSVFQKIWDNILSKANVMVILCGSLISMMVSQTLSYSSPLYGRRTSQIRLKQIPFSYYKEFYPWKMGQRELVERYAISGGVPKYIELFAGEGNLTDVIKDKVLDSNCYLYNEPQFLLQQEVSEIGTYFTLLRIIANGSHKLSEIAGVAGLKATGITKYLKVLEELDIIERRVPVTEDNPEKSKKGLYFIKDNYISFWFAFVYPYMDWLELGKKESVLEKIQSGFIPNHVSYVYEDICRQKMWDLCASDVWPFLITKVGGFWSNEAEVDIVALDETGNNIILGECKYTINPVGVDIFKALEQKSDKVKWRNENRKESYVLFSTGGFTDELRKMAGERDDLQLIEEI